MTRRKVLPVISWRMMYIKLGLEAMTKSAGLRGVLLTMVFYGGLLWPVSAFAEGYKMRISFTNYNGTETLTNFPVLLVFSNNMVTRFDPGTFLSTDGYDLRFWGDDKLTSNLNCETETWSTSSTSYVWVQIPQFTSNCHIWATWGDPAKTNQQNTCTNGATWSNGYLGVWHMNSTALDDSTSNKLSGSNTGVSNVVGISGGGQYFDNGDQIVIPASPRFSGDMTQSLWFKGTYSADGSYGAMLIDRRAGSGNVVALESVDPNGAIFLQTGFGGTSLRTGLNDGQWHQIVINFPASSSTGNATGKLYIDGVLDYQAEAAVNWPAAQQIELGRSHDPFWKKFIGTMDEFEISSGFRSSNWIWACYMNQASNSMFNSYAPVHAQQSGTVMIIR